MDQKNLKSEENKKKEEEGFCESNLRPSPIRVKKSLPGGAGIRVLYNENNVEKQFEDIEPKTSSELDFDDL